jgi:MFS family permease
VQRIGPKATIAKDRRIVQLMVVALVVVTGSLAVNLFTASLPLYLARDRAYSIGLIGTLVGVAFVPQVLAPVFIGSLIDRRGPRYALRIGTTFLLMASLVLLEIPAPFAIATSRVLQGLGLALLMPSMYALVSRLVDRRLLGTAVGGFGAFNNVGIAIGPAAGIWLLGVGSQWLFVGAVVAATAATCFSLLISPTRPTAQPKRLISYELSWTAPLLVVFASNVSFGILLAFLPISVSGSSAASVAWYFSADAIGILAFRVLAGYLTDRYGSRWLTVVGAIVLAGSMVLLFAPASALLFVLAGIGTGAGTALLLPPILVELTNRSAITTRGSAMAMYSMSLSAAIATGSFGAAPLVEHFGFHAALVVGIVLCLCGLPISVIGLANPSGLLHPES